MVSKTCQYALRAIIYIAGKENREFIPIKEIAEENDISYFFLGKIMNILIRKRLVVSYKGPNGGVKLSRPAEEITLLDVVEAVDGTGFKNECFIGLPDCSDDSHCPVHNSWKKVREAYVNMLSEKTIGKLVRGLQKG